MGWASLEQGSSECPLPQNVLPDTWIPKPAFALFLGSVRDEIGAVGQQETWSIQGRADGLSHCPHPLLPQKPPVFPGGEQIPAVLPDKPAVYFWVDVWPARRFGHEDWGAARCLP